MHIYRLFYIARCSLSSCALYAVTNELKDSIITEIKALDSYLYTSILVESDSLKFLHHKRSSTMAFGDDDDAEGKGVYTGSIA